MPNRVKVLEAEWDLRPKTKFLRVKGYVLTDSGDEVIAKIKKPPGIKDKFLLINLEIKASEGLTVPFSTKVPVPFYFRKMAYGHEPWEEVQVCLEDDCTSHAITKIEYEVTKKTEKAKTFHFSGNGLKIKLSMEDSKEMEFVYEDSLGERKFYGQSIYRNETMMGLMASVIIEQVPDKYEKIFTIAIPLTNITENAKSVQVKSFAIRTTTQTSIAGTSSSGGQKQTYEALILEGNAW